MVYTKHGRVKRGADKPARKAVNKSEHRSNLVNYVLNEKKTEELEFVSDYGFNNYLDFPNKEDATKMYEYQMTLTDNLYYEKNGHTKKESDVVAHHLIQSFSPEDNLTAEQINKIGYELAKKITGGNFQFIVSTHTESDHIHNHIIINNVNMDGTKKLHWNDKLHREMVAESDRLGELHGAKIIDVQKDFTYQEYKQYRNSSFTYQLKQRIDYLLKNSHSYDDFLERASLMNVKIDQRGNSTTFLMTDTDQKNVIRDRKLNKKVPMNEDYFRRYFAKKELNRRLDFLFDNSNDWDDFKQKAYALGLTLKEKDKHVEFHFRLPPSEGQKGRYAIEVNQFIFSDDELNKQKKMDIEFFKRMFENRETSKDKVDLKIIQSLYREHQQINEPQSDLSSFYDDFKESQEEKKVTGDFEVVLKDWQVQKETEKGLHVKVWMGLDRQGLLFIPNKNLTIEKMGKENKKQYTIHLNEKEFYYIHSQKEEDNLNRYMTGQTLIKQLSSRSQEIPQRKYVTTEDIREKIIKISFLNRIKTSREDLIAFRDQFVTDFANQEEKLNKMKHRYDELLHAKSIFEGMKSEDEDIQRAAKYEYAVANFTEGFTLDRVIDELAAFEDLMDDEVERLKAYSKRLDEFVGIINQGERPPEMRQEQYMQHQEERRHQESRGIDL